jgi:hypothetical protein
MMMEQVYLEDNENNLCNDKLCNKDPNHSKALRHAPMRKKGERGGENIKKRRRVKRVGEKKTREVKGAFVMESDLMQK